MHSQEGGWEGLEIGFFVHFEPAVKFVLGKEGKHESNKKNQVIKCVD